MRTEILASLGLQFNPFTVATSTTGYFHTELTDLVLEELLYGIESRKGFLVLVGEVGVGKTSLLLQLIQKLDQKEVRTSWIFNTILSKEELLRAIARDFGIDLPENASVGATVDELHQFFLNHNQAGTNCAIILDEAHNIPDDALEALRMLSNLESQGTKLVQILLIGQTELKKRIDTPQLRQLRSRIVLYKELAPFSFEETCRYVHFKLAAAGGHIRTEKRSLRRLWAATRGNPRLINLILERSLYALSLQGNRTITPAILGEAIGEIGQCQSDILARAPVFSRKGLKHGLCITFAGLFLGAAAWVFLLQNGTWSSLPSDLGSLVSSGTKETNAENGVQSAANKFLAQAGLEYLQDAFSEILRSGSWEDFSTKLPRGFQLFGAENVWDSPVHHTTFPWKEYAGQGPNYLVLWQPPVQIRDYYPLYKGPEIAALQKHLARLNIYQAEIDGMVGVQTWAAIDRLQQELGLPRTGQPDPQTLFALFHRLSLQEGQAEASKLENL